MSSRYDADEWETLRAPIQMWGVFFAFDTENEPLAIFFSAKTCLRWVRHQQALGPGQSELGGEDYSILPIEILSGYVWNSEEDAPPLMPLQEQETQDEQGQKD